MIKAFLFFLKFINNHSPFHFKLFIFLSSLTSIIQSVGIVSILPLITLITEPNLIIKNQYFLEYYFLNYSDISELTFQLTSIFIILNVLGVLLFFSSEILGEYVSRNTIAKVRIDLYRKLLNSNITSVNIRSSFLNYILHEMAKFNVVIVSVNNFFQVTITIVIFLFASILIYFNLIFIAVLIAILYFSIFTIVKKPLNYISKYTSAISKKMNQFNIYFNLGIKDLLALKIGKKIFNMYSHYEKIQIINTLKTRFYSVFPKYIFEIILYVVIGFLIIHTLNSDIMRENIPIFTVMAIFAWRSIPLYFRLFRIMASIQENITAYINYQKLGSLHNYKQHTLKQISDFKNNIELKKIKFSYDKKNQFEFNFKIKKGDKILIKGDSGSGKTTLLNLLTGLLPPQSGDIFFDKKKVDYQKFTTSIFGYVTQDPLLFSGSIFENICITGKKTKNNNFMKKIKLIYKICELNKICSKFDDIFTKKIEIDSPELSGGQKQRISIARVLLLNPKILILDEATSALDRKSEKTIFNNIIKNYKKITLIAVSHRPFKGMFNKRIDLT